MTIKTTQRLALAVPILALLSFGCDNKDKGGGTPSTGTASASATTAATTAPPASASASASAGPAGRGHPERRFGMSGMLFQAARDLPDLTADQKDKIDKIEEPLRSEDPAAKEEHKQFHSDLMAGVKAGKIDTAKLTAHYATFDKFMQARQDKEVEALNGLFAALDATHRKALTAAVRSKQAEREARWAARDAGAGFDAGTAADMQKRQLERMTKELDLDATQQKSIGAIFAKAAPPAQNMESMKAEGKKRTEALLTAFEGETFDAKKLDLWPMTAKKMHEMMDRRVQFLAGVTPILKDEQRSKLAARMDRMMAGPRGRDQGDMMPYDGPLFEDEPRQTIE